MGQNHDTPNPSRRSLLAALPAAGLAASVGLPRPASHIAPASPSYNPDARLIALCETFIRERDEADGISARYFSVTGDCMSKVEKARIRELVDRSWRIRDMVARWPARTPAGVFAKARLVERSLRDACKWPECVTVNEEMAPYYSLAEDVVAILARQVSA